MCFIGMAIKNIHKLIKKGIVFASVPFLFQVLVRNSLAVLSGSESPRVFCENLNISVCPLTESSQKVLYRDFSKYIHTLKSTFTIELWSFSFFILSQFSMNVYNPLGRTVSWPVRLPVNGSLYSVTDTNGKAVDSQVGNYVFMSFKRVCNIYDMKSSSLLPLLSVRWFHSLSQHSKWGGTEVMLKVSWFSRLKLLLLATLRTSSPC